MDKLQKIILISICIVIIVILLIVFAMSRLDETKDDPESYDYTYIEEIEEANILEEVDVRNNFYSVKGCIEKLYSYYGEIFDPEAEDSQGAQKAVYNMLDDKYKEYKGITESNIKEKIEPVNPSKVSINEMYVNQKTQDIYVYIAKGRLREISSRNISDFEVIITLDTNNKTFTVMLGDYVKEFYSDIVLGEELKIETPEDIEVNDYNKYDYEIIDDQTYIQDLIEKYKDEMLFDTESAYNHLDKDYREKRFESLSDFQTYAKENTIKNVTLKLDQYKKKVYDGYTEYVCIDKKGNYYIFKEKYVMNYGMILDTYTIDLPDFIETYDDSKEEQKVALNINKIITAINEKDYKFVYNKLNSTYKNTYFSDYNAFVTVMKNNFYASNELSIEKCDSIGQNTYTSTIKISNSDNSEETKSLTIIVRLLEERNFEMSFGIE